MFNIDKYKFYVYAIKGITRVKAVSTYCGKNVFGVAKCDPNDTFSIEKGKILAAARCNQKIARKRVKRAEKKYEDSIEMIERAKIYSHKMNRYFIDAIHAEEIASIELEEVINNL
jgi:hypothetical protein